MQQHSPALKVTDFESGVLHLRLVVYAQDKFVTGQIKWVMTM